MKIALVNLKSTILTNPMVWQPLGLFYLSSRLQSLGHETFFYDLNEDKIPEDVYEQIWVSASAPQIAEARKFANETKNYKAKRVLGGALVWEHPPSAYDLGYDLIVSGEADEPNNCQLVLESVYNPPESKHLNLPVSKTLDWVLPPDKRWTNRYNSKIKSPNGESFLSTSMMTTRGCPCACAFCTSGRLGVIWDKYVRYEPYWSVKQQIEEIYAMGYRAIAYYDDQLILKKDRVRELLDLHKKYGMVWRCFLRSDIIHKYGGKDYLRELRDGGLVEIFVGVESADNQIKNNISKGTTIEQDTNILEWCRELNITCKMSFILGLPGETKESLEKTRQWILKYRPHRTQVDNLLPFPGTPLTRHPEKYDLNYDIIPPEDWFYKGREDLDVRGFVSTSHLTRQEIIEFHAKLEKEMKDLGITG